MFLQDLVSFNTFKKVTGPSQPQQPTYKDYNERMEDVQNILGSKASNTEDPRYNDSICSREFYRILPNFAENTNTEDWLVIKVC